MNTTISDLSMPSKNSVLVTGGGSGIGQLLSISLAKAGAHVTITGRRLDPLRETQDKIRSENGLCSLVQADMTKTSDVDRAFKVLGNKHAGVHSLICCAGMLGPIASVLKVDENEWLDAINSNIRATLIPAKYALEHMSKTGSGRIIILSSVAARGAVTGNISAYAISKAAIDRFVQCTATELMNTNITICAIHPTAISTPMMEQLYKVSSEEDVDLQPLNLWAGRILSGEVDGKQALIEKVLHIIISQNSNYNGEILPC